VRFPCRLRKANHVSDRLIRYDPGSRIKALHISIKPFAHGGVFDSPAFLEKGEDFTFVAPDMVDARQQRFNDLDDLLRRLLDLVT